MRFNSDQIRGILAAHGYTSNPDGLVEPFPWDYLETKDVAYLDIHADAVRNGDVVPDRPVRITFQKIEVGNGPGGALYRWKVKSVEELVPGVASKCLDRQPGTPKVSPWPEKKTKRVPVRPAVAVPRNKGAKPDRTSNLRRPK
jgi:hypothetical protein